MENFEMLGLPQQLIDSLEILNFKNPTPIQAQAIPHALEGRDILGSAQTGTGKTAAFGIPLVSKLMLTSKGSALVMTPTRELAMQVMKNLESLIGGANKSIKTALLIGGEPIGRQLDKLKNRPRLIVGTPGRINDHLLRGSLALHDTHFLVMDETDRMLDMGFTIQIEKILKYMPKQRQTLLFSATISKTVTNIAKQYLDNPVFIEVAKSSTAVEKINQEVINTTEENKFLNLTEQLNQRDGSIIIFVKTKWGADKLAQRLRKESYSADAIHGDLRHSKREIVIRNFRNEKYQILVATDIAARGLDIPHVRHVINYDLPQCPEDYIHRIGRTGRAGAEGEALCLISPADKQKWKEISRLMNPELHKNDERVASSSSANSSDNRRKGSGSSRFKKFKSRGGNSGSGNGGNGGGEKSSKPYAKNKGNKRNFKPANNKKAA